MNEMTALAGLGEQLDPPTAFPPADVRRRVMIATTRRRIFTLPRLAVAGALAAVVTGAVLAGQVIGLGDSDLGLDRLQRQQPDHFRRPLSVDGTHDGLVSSRPRDGSSGWKDHAMPGCRDGVMKVTEGPKTGESACRPSPGYRGDLPTEPGAVLAYLRAQGGSKNGPDQDAFTTAGDLIREAYLQPAVLAAVFEAVGRIPGVTAAGTVTDAAGRAGLAVTRDEVQGHRVDLIFDPETYAYLGERVVVPQDEEQDGLKAGQVLRATAVQRVAVVSAAGELP